MISYDGKASGLPTRLDGVAVPSAPGAVSEQFARSDGGVFGGLVTLSRPGVVMLKASSDPNWRATIDGKEVTPQMLAPSFVGIPVPAGIHSVEFKYQTYQWAWILVLFGANVLIGLAIIPRILEKRRGVLAS